MKPVDPVAERWAAVHSFARTAPPGALPLLHFGAAGVCFWLFGAGLLLGAGRLVGFDLQARWALGLVHLLTLGWVAMTLLGALLQMTAVHGRRGLALAPLAYAGWALLAGGLATFVGLLWAGSDRYWLGAALAASGVALDLLVLVLTMARAEASDFTSRHFAVGLAFLASLATVGLLMALDRGRGVLVPDPDGALIAHVHLALVGWVSISILGASYRLVPPVALFRARSRLAGRLALGLAAFGAGGLAVDALWGGRGWLPLWACVLVAAFGLYARQALADSPAKGPSAALTDFSLAGGAAWCALGLFMAFQREPSSASQRAAYVFLALLGWVTPHILAQIQKILPFVVWMRLSQRLDPAQVPKTDALSLPSVGWAQLAALELAVPLGAAGLLRENAALVRAGGFCVLACASLHLLNAGRALSWLRLPARDAP